MVQTNKRPVGRFAPTPSGRLHLGNLACALVAYLSVAARGGALRLRIEDLDAARCAAMEENTRWLLDDLSYFGIPFEGEVLYQSRRTEIYEQAFNKLKEKGLIYPCYCSRAELHAATAPNRGDAAPVYDRRCLLHPPKVLPARPPAYRVRVPAGRISFTDRVFGAYSEEPERDCGDFIVRRSDGVFAYQLAVVVDDAASGVSEVVRGCDLLSSTPRQIYLQRELGLPTPEYCHIPLLTDAAGRRLSKSEGDGCMARVRAAYPDPRPVLGALAAALGILPAPESVSLSDLVREFSPDKIRREEVRLPPGFLS